MNNSIDKIIATETSDSRGNPTISVTVYVGEVSGNFSVPSGASTGANEAHELRDKDGKGVSQAIENINKIIAPALIGQNVCDQRSIDETMIALDDTKQKKNLGGNAMIGVSIACAKAAASVKRVEVYEHLETLAEMKPSRSIPLLYMNLINGGKHAHNNLAFQEYHIVPFVDDINESVEIGLKIQTTLEKMIGEELGKEMLVLGDEGGFAPNVKNIREPLVYLSRAIKENNLEDKVRLALDVAASSFYENGTYLVDGKKISNDELMSIYNNLIEEFNLLSIEDPFDEESFDDFKKLKNENNIKIVGDDLTVTNVERLHLAIKNDSINAMIIKPNQIGTLSETLSTMRLARESDIELIISHRSGETDDNFIADLAYAFRCFGLKSGSPRKTERMVKYKRLIEITNK